MLVRKHWSHLDSRKDNLLWRLFLVLHFFGQLPGPYTCLSPVIFHLSHNLLPLASFLCMMWILVSVSQNAEKRKYEFINPISCQKCLKTAWVFQLGDSFAVKIHALDSYTFSNPSISNIIVYNVIYTNM